MNSETIKQDSRFKLSNLLLMAIALFMFSILLSLSSDWFEDIDNKVSQSVAETFGVNYIGNIQQTEARVIGPYKSITYLYFEKDGIQISAKSHQWLAFEPKITCLSSNPDSICQ